ncbi:MAG: DNA polymerase Y family protein [Bacteroidota bacterium]
MSLRIVHIWFERLVTDWVIRRQPELKQIPFALAMQERNRRVIKAVNETAQAGGIYTNMVLADALALMPELEVMDYDTGQAAKLLNALAEWCIRYTPVVAIDLPDGLFMDVSGCTHLWGGEKEYILDIQKRLNVFGYTVQVAIADTPGAAWALSHFGEAMHVVADEQLQALSPLPVAALRLETSIVDRLEKLGLRTIGSFMRMPRTALFRRFGPSLLMRLDQATGTEMELLEPVKPPVPYHERLPCLEPINTAVGIEIALKNLLEILCLRLQRESKGMRQCNFIGLRLDGQVEKISIGTSRPSRNVQHLFKLFENKIQSIEPDLGIDLFILEAPVVEELHGSQDALWQATNAGEIAIAELLDRFSGKAKTLSIHRYLPAEHYWPERSVKEAGSLSEQPATLWRNDLLRPPHLLLHPELIEVSVLLPDYPPLLFIHKGILHTVKKADGPERIEQEWWLQEGLYRDYYCVEDQHGARYWLFRLGDYDSGDVKWFLHGFFS